MSQKYQALQTYTELKDAYESSTNWQTQATVAVTLVPTDEAMPSDIDAFVEQKVQDLVDQVDRAFYGNDWPLFVRACPLVPRPGVLESSRADDLDAVAVVAERIISTMMSPDPSDSPMYEHGITDPHGTVMVQPFVKANASAVVAPDNYILMGPNHDGVTAGNEDQFTVALPLQRCVNTNNDLKRMDMDPNHIEIEFVSELRDPTTNPMRSRGTPNQKYAMVQLRGSEGHRPIAPAPKGVTISGTFHGEERITIDHIHLVSDNTDEQLDKMEQALREGMPPNSVVLHPNGSHLSHHAGQCFKYGVPYIASTEPRVGEQWTQAALGWVVLDNDGTYEPQPYDPLDFAQQFITGFNVGFTNYGRQHGWLSNHFHQFIGGPIDDPARTAHYAGAYVAWLINASLSVGFGELRHLHSHAQNSTALAGATIVAVFGEDRWVEVTKCKDNLTHNRQSYYMMIEENPLTLDSVVALLEFAMKCYSLPWSSSYGGQKYKTSCANARDLALTVKAFLDEQSDENFKEMLAKANLTEHNVHNGGFFFNKFMHKRALDWGTDSSQIDLTRPADFFAVYYAAEDVYNAVPREPRDITHILDLSNSITISDLMTTPIAVRDDIIGHSVSYLSMNMRHPSGKYSDYSNNLFIQCGMEDCEHCAYVKKQKLESVSSEVIKITESYEASFPVADEVLQSLNATTKHLKQVSATANKTGTLPENIAVDLAHLFNNEMIGKESHKYVANIISYFTDEQLKQFSNLKED